MTASNMMLHCGAQLVSYEDVARIEAPAATGTFHPIAHRDLIDELRARVMHVFPSCDVIERYGMTEGGRQLFGTFDLQLDEGVSDVLPVNVLSIGFRNSIDKTLSAAFCAGLRVFVCDNLCLSGDYFLYVRKHTRNVWRDVRDAIANNVSQALPAFQTVTTELKKLAELPCTTERGYELLGLSLGQKQLTATQANVAFRDWDTPRHAEFEERNLYSLYNCMNEGTKRGVPSQYFDRHAGVHSFFKTLPEWNGVEQTLGARMGVEVLDAEPVDFAHDGDALHAENREVRR